MLPTGVRIDVGKLNATPAPVVCTLLPKLVEFVAADTNTKFAEPNPETAKLTSSVAELKLIIPLADVMLLPLIRMFPIAALTLSIALFEITLPAYKLPVAVINPAVAILPPSMLPVALTRPPVNTLPPTTLPDTVNKFADLSNVKPALAPKMSPVSLNCT